MTKKEINDLRLSDEAPYNHDAFAFWLHNKILEKIQYELQEFREMKSLEIQSSYAACNHIMSLPSLKPIK